MNEMAQHLAQRAEANDRRAQWGYRAVFVRAHQLVGEHVDTLTEAKVVVVSHYRHQFEISRFDQIGVIIDSFERTNHSADAWTAVPIGSGYLLCFNSDVDAIMARLAVDN